MSVLMEKLLGIRDAANTMITHTEQRSPGIFGNTRGVIGCIETQNRGSLHTHLLVTSNVTRSTLYRAMTSRDPELVGLAKEYVDMCCTSSMSDVYSPEDIDTAAHTVFNSAPAGSTLTFEQAKSVFVDYDERRTDEQNDAINAFFLAAPVFDSIADMNVRGVIALIRAQVHKHSFTCHKLPAGLLGCRVNMYRLLCTEPGASVWLLLRRDPYDAKSRAALDTKKGQTASTTSNGQAPDFAVTTHRLPLDPTQITDAEDLATRLLYTVNPKYRKWIKSLWRREGAEGALIWTHRPANSTFFHLQLEDMPGAPVV
jgi:hypothetical protein